MVTDKDFYVSICGIIKLLEDRMAYIEQRISSVSGLVVVYGVDGTQIDKELWEAEQWVEMAKWRVILDNLKTIKLYHEFQESLGIVEDLAQDMRIMLLEGIKPISIERRVIDVLRSRRYKYTSFYHVVHGITHTLMVDDDIIERIALNEFLDTLSVKDREIMKYRLEGYTCEQIGKLVSISRATVGSIIRRIQKEREKWYMTV
jgi:RNA polymerase sigma factor (sigma-70 family)